MDFRCNNNRVQYYSDRNIETKICIEEIADCNRGKGRVFLKLYLTV